MADTVHDYVNELGVELILPSFLEGCEQLSLQENIRSQQISNERFYVERMIQTLKCYHIFDQVIPVNMLGSVNQLIAIRVVLSNFQDPIIKN